MRPAAYICSTVTTHIEVVQYATDRGPLPAVVRKFNIMGGANLPPKTLVTPKGVLTPISADDLGWLATQPEFLRLKKAGFVEIITSKSEDDLDAAVAGMEPKDRCAPKTPADFAKPPAVSVAA